MVLPLLVAACSSTSPTVPATLNPVAATVVISNLTASVESTSPGFVYHVAMHVAETGGKSAATFGSVAVAFPDGRGSIATLPAAITIPAGTGQDIGTFDVTDPTGTTAEPQISVLLHFADNAGLVGTVTSSAVPVH